MYPVGQGSSSGRFLPDLAKSHLSPISGEREEEGAEGKGGKGEGGREGGESGEGGRGKGGGKV